MFDQKISTETILKFTFKKCNHNSQKYRKFPKYKLVHKMIRKILNKNYRENQNCSIQNHPSKLS